MIRFGLWLLVISAVLWIVIPIYAITYQTDPNIGLVISAVVIGIIGSVTILIGVIKDRYLEFKEDEKNNDYRKY